MMNLPAGAPSERSCRVTKKRRKPTAQSGRLAGKTAIITGATAGIGAATARLFAREGARLVLVARRPEPGERLIAEIGAERGIFVTGDVTDPGTAEVATREAARFGGVDVLVNNAGIDFTSPVLEADLADVRRVFEVNFVGAYKMFRAVARAMLGRGGSIVNVTSRTASVGVPSMAIYGASKGALLSLTRAAAVELAERGIRVNAVAPGLTETPLLDEWVEAQPNPMAFKEAVVATIPQHRFARPGDVAEAILYLASDESDHVTGASIAVDGGYTAA